jgi:PAS domain S-box-containing protein
MDQGYELLSKGVRIILYFFQEEVLLSWKWWLVTCFSIFPWVGVYLFLKKDKRKQYLVSALIIMVLASFFDIIGLSHNLWRYYVMVFPVLGGFFPWNFSVVPICFIISYEVFPKITPIVKGVIVSLMSAYIGEPASDYFGFTKHEPWRHTYSVPIYFGIYLLSYYGGRALSQKKERRPKKLSVVDKNDKYHYAFENSFNGIYLIEKKHWEMNFRFTEVNESFCKEMGYTKEEVFTLDPRLISDQKSYNVDIKYRPLLKMGNMRIDTTFVTKTGEKKFVNLLVKVFWRKDKIEILSIANFSEKKVSDYEAN